MKSDRTSRARGRSWRARSVTLPSACLLALLVTAFASCATKGGSEPPDDDASSALPPPDASIPDADLPEVGCDASDPGCITEVVPCETVSWCLSPSPVEPRLALTAVWGTSAADVWAVGAAGAIIHHEGAAWASTPSGYLQTFYAVWGSGPRDIWVVSTGNLVLHGTGFRDGTATWENVPLVTHSTVSNPEMALGAGLALHAIWGTSVNDVRLAGNATTISLDTPGFLYHGSSNHAVKSRLSDGGVLWRMLPARTETVRSIWGSASDDVWMAGDDGLTLHGTPYLGASPHPDLLTETGTCILGCFTGCTACALGSDTLEWTAIDSQSRQDIEAIWGSSGADVWAVGELGTIRRFRRGDDRWRKVESPTKARLRAIWGSGPDDVWIVGDDATVLHYDGTTMTPSSVQLPLGPRPSLRGIWGSGPNDVWIVGDSATILHYTGPKPGVEGAGGS